MPVHRPLSVLPSIAAFLLLSAGVIAAGEAYDPMKLSGEKAPAPVDLTVADSARDREIPIRVYLPADAKAPAPVVLFSHGLGGSREGNGYLGRHWAGRGYVVVFLQHPGSDSSVWRDKPLSERMSSLKGAADASNLILRVKDVPAVLDQLARWNKEESHALHGRLDLEKVGMSGHSFGAVTTQSVSGQSLPRGNQPFTDPRIKAALAMSPSPSRRGGDPKLAFGKVAIPWMLMTGTEDDSPIGDTSPQDRLAVYPALPAGGKYELVLDGAEHSAFSERGLPGDRKSRNPNHHRAILALSTAFWDAWLRGDAAAKAWLDGEGAKSVLEKKDGWQRK